MLGSLGTLKQLIPSLSFAGVYGASCSEPQNSSSIAQETEETQNWKIGIAHVSYNNEWSFEHTSYFAIHIYETTILVSPGITAYPGRSGVGYYGASIAFLSNAIVLKGNGQYTAILFNY